MVCAAELPIATPYWPAGTDNAVGTIWLRQDDEPDAAKQWRPVTAVAFTPGTVLRQLFTTGGHDLFFQPTGGIGVGTSVEIHVDVA